MNHKFTAPKKLRYLTPAFLDRHKNERVLIWSGEHGAYWRANAQGYSVHPKSAGIYTLGEAYGAAGHCGPEKKIEFQPYASSVFGHADAEFGHLFAR